MKELGWVGPAGHTLQLRNGERQDVRVVQPLDVRLSVRQADEHLQWADWTSVAERRHFAPRPFLQPLVKRGCWAPQDWARIGVAPDEACHACGARVGSG